MACHLAVTPVGRSALEGSGCLPRWLARWQKLLPRQRLMVLMVLLACIENWSKMPYFQPLFRGGEWVRGVISADADPYKAYDKTRVPAAILRQVWSRSQYQSHHTHACAYSRGAHRLIRSTRTQAVTAGALTVPVTSHAQQRSQSQSRF